MSTKGAVPLLALALIVSPPAQQTGTVMSTTPGSTIGKRLPGAVQVPPPEPTCESRDIVRADANGSPALPEMVFSRTSDDLVCLRHRDGRSEKLLKGGPWMQLSGDGNDLAYWIPDKHELRIYSIPSRSDTTVDTAPGARMRELVWSSKGRTLAYLLDGANPPGIRIVDLNSGKRLILSGNFIALAASPDPAYAVAVTTEGVQRIRIADGQRELVAAIEYAASAAYSRSGALLGVLASEPRPAAQAQEDDGPDCTGATFALFVQKAGTKQLVKVQFPPGFDSVLDFSFSPDDSAAAVSFGAAACDYPGDVARVYLLSLADLKLRPISPAGRLSVKAQWSPDSKTIAYTDYTGSESPLMAVDLRSGRATRLTSPGPNGPDDFLGWR